MNTKQFFPLMLLFIFVCMHTVHGAAEKQDPRAALTGLFEECFPAYKGTGQTALNSALARIVTRQFDTKTSEPSAIVKCLAGLGADVNAPHSNGKLIDVAVENGDLTMVVMLARLGAKIDGETLKLVEKGTPCDAFLSGPLAAANRED